MAEFFCVVCRTVKHGSPYILKFGGLWDVIREDPNLNLADIHVGQAYCAACYMRYKRKIRSQERSQQRVEDEMEILNNDNLGQLVRTIPTSQTCCCVCGSRAGRSRIPVKVAASVWARQEVFLPQHNRCCTEHIENDSFNCDAVQKILERSYPTRMDPVILLGHINKFLKSQVTTPAPSSNNILDFDSPNVTESDYVCYTGLTSQQFDEVQSYIQSDMRNSVNRSVRNALAMFLCKLRMDMSQDQIAHLFGTTQPRVSDAFNAVTESLDNNFVPVHLGFHHLPREELLRTHQTVISTVLFDRDPHSTVVILDGTYLEIQSSTNYSFQHDTYSMQKHYNLLKPMVVCTATGYIIAIVGPFYGVNNDASILNFMLGEDSEFKEYFHEGDVVIVDRGFRDSITNLTDAGYRPHMPSFLPPGASQLTCEEANATRCVTKVRWVVESVNGRIKNRFKFFRNQIPNSYVPKIPKLFRIACALLNAFFVPLATDKPGDLELANSMKARSELTNLMQEWIEQGGYENLRVVWNPLGANDLPDFPRLSADDLRELTLGVYQLKQAKSYTAMHMSAGDYNFSVHREFHDLIRIRMESRFRSNKFHYTWIMFEPYGEGTGSIRGYYCKCQVGARTFGTCSHVASVVWYLSYSRHHEEFRAPAGTISENVLDARQ